MPNEPRVLACARADSPLTVTGSKFDRACAECGEKVMTSPLSQKMLEEYPDTIIGCLQCVMKQSHKISAVAIPGGDLGAALEEAKNIIPNTWRERN